MNSSFRILIADRNRHVREFLQREFSSAGYQCELAANGQEILSRLQDPPHVLILDLEIPIIDGWQLLEAFATHRPRVPVIVHTFLGEYFNHPLLASADALVEKKGDPDSLKAAVLEVLARYYPEKLFAERRPSCSPAS